MTDRDRNDSGRSAARRLDRRVILKASAAFGAMSLIGAGAATRQARAQTGGTIAGTWVEAENALVAAAVDGGAQSFQTDFPFVALAPHWSAAAGFGAWVQFSVSADGVTWSESFTSYEAVEDAGQPDLGGRRYGQLIATGPASFVQYQAYDANGNPTILPGLAFTYIDSTSGPTIDDVYAAALTPSVARPPIISRAAWGADESYRYNQRGEIWPPSYQTVEHVIIHHTDTANFQDPLVAMRAIYYYHAVTRGWGDIGYNYLVDFLGNVYEGRVGGENVIGGHSYSYARGSSGIGTIGRFSFQSTTPEAQAGLVWITAWVGRNLNPLGRKPFQDIPSLPVICAHRDVNNTTCPGDFLYGDLPTIREYVSAVLGGSVDPAPNPEYVAGDVIETTVVDANLRRGPGLGFDVLVRMALGQVATIVDGPTTNDGYTWYQIQGPTLTGWAATVVFRRQAPAPPPPPPPPPGAFAVGDRVAVNTGGLNLRSTPALGGGIIATMPFGTPCTVAAGPQSADGYTWYQLSTGFGTGWGAGEFLVLTSSPPPPPPPPSGFAVGSTVSVNTNVLNLRSGPSLGGAVVGQMPFGTRLTITQAAVVADGYTWYGVSSGQYGAGWCAGELLTAAGGNPSPDPGPGIQIGDAVRVTGGNLNLRSAPTTSAAILNVLPDGTQLQVTGGPQTADGYTWHQVSSSAYGAGWCAGAFLQEV